MFKRLVACVLGLSFLVSYQAANATIDLNVAAFNADGVFSFTSLGSWSSPAAGTLDGSGLGTLTYSVTGAGTHNFIGLFDYEIDQSVNGFTNEYGTVNGTLGAGQSYEIDEPGYAWGDLGNNVKSGVLDNTNSIPASYQNPDPTVTHKGDDVAFALGWNFSLGIGQTATITMNMTDTLPTTLPDFYLAQYDHDPASANEHIYYWGDLSITGQQPSGSVPEPGSLALFGAGLLMLGATRKARKRS